MKFSPNYQFDEFLLENFEILLHEIWLYEIIDKSDNKKWINTTCLNERELEYLVSIFEKISIINNDNIKAYSQDDEYFERHKIKYESTISSADKLRLGYFVFEDKIVQFDRMRIIGKGSDYYSFLFALKLRQYHLAPELIQKYLHFHYAKYFVKKINIFNTFIRVNILEQYPDIFFESIRDKILNIMKSDYSSKKSDYSVDRLLIKVNPKLEKYKIEEYFMKLAKPFGPQGNPIVPKENVKLFLKANFVAFSDTDSKFREKIEIEFGQDNVKGIVKRYIYDFRKYMGKGEILKQYSKLFFDSFIEFRDTDFVTITSSFSYAPSEKYIEFINSK